MMASATRRRGSSLLIRLGTKSVISVVREDLNPHEAAEWWLQAIALAKENKERGGWLTVIDVAGRIQMFPWHRVLSATVEERR